MTVTKQALKMPELMVFAKVFLVGFVAAEVFWAAYYLGTAFTLAYVDFPLWARVTAVLVGLAVCVAYVVNRGAHTAAVQIGRSFRFDLLMALCLGAWSNELTMPWLSEFHYALKSANSHWAPVVLLLFCTVLLSPLIQRHWPRRRQKEPQPPLLTDKEIERNTDDLLSIDSQAKSFAETVLASSVQTGLVFGVDGPWGVGKTSFINLAARYWELAEDKVIVCRFEPLRYASEPDLADRLIRDLSGVIQNKVFAPEFRPAASRYSRLIKGKADVSFLGFKLSLDPSQESVDELLDEIDDVLRRIGRRVIIVIDDFDRLDAKTVNNVLFATRRTFKLSQATYILCYDTEVLAGGKEEGSRAREFLEKFVAVKLSLFVDSSSIRKFLQRDWEKSASQLGFMPSDTMVKLGALFTELAEILAGESAAKYLPLIGDLRKVKRFTNAILVMQIEKTELGRTDFNKRDLINLMLLHFNYPGLFRRIYAEETDGRSGTFSIRRNYDEPNFQNDEEFSTVKLDYKGSASFLLEQLFDVGVLDLGDGRNIEESVLRSRACFNNGKTRNLESFLRLIVRFTPPLPKETFVLYTDAVALVCKGRSITSVLSESEFSLEKEETAHDQFWRVLVNRIDDFTSPAAEDAIKTLVEYLPRYSSVNNDDRGLRQISIYSLVLLLDGAGWGRTAGGRRANTSENVIEIAWRIFGENAFVGRGLLEQLASPERGVLGWNDLMFFRLYCSADRGGRLHNLYNALIVHQDISAPTSGVVSKLALMGMRTLSQQVFAYFKRSYIGARRNFIAEACKVPVDSLLGQAFTHLCEQASLDPGSEHGDTTIARRVAEKRSSVASFVIYQLSNSLPPKGSGVGCGYYDESGAQDGGGISRLMNEYVFDFCFSPHIHGGNVLLFLDHCLAHLSSPFHTGQDEEGYVATKMGLPGGLDPKAMGKFWLAHRDHIRGLELQNNERCVSMRSYTALYRDKLGGVFSVLDELAEDAASATPVPHT